MDLIQTPITLRRMTAGDIPMLHGWLNRPHLMKWWGGESPTLAQVHEKYVSKTLAASRVIAYVGMLGERPFAYAQSYVALGAGGGWWEAETDPGVRGIDQFIADPELLGKGFGTRLVCAVVDVIFSDSQVSKIQADPAPHNFRAIRCYEKAGFRKLGVIDTPDGSAVYMICNRPGSGEPKIPPDASSRPTPPRGAA